MGARPKRLANLRNVRHTLAQLELVMPSVFSGPLDDLWRASTRSVLARERERERIRLEAPLQRLSSLNTRMGAETGHKKMSSASN